MKKCPNCSAMCKDNDFYCLKCNHPLSNKNIFLTNDEYNNSNHITTSSTIKKTNKPQCPTCHSYNVRPISGLNRAGSIFAWGLFSSKIGKTYECLNCKYKW